MDLSALTVTANKAAKAAGSEILAVYRSADTVVEYKEDNSPLTKADKGAHAAILPILESTGYPILSEEGRDIPYEERRHWDIFWLVDPLDGTKEFIKRNGEFTVNIALVKDDKPVIGVIYVPVTGLLYWANPVDGAWKEKEGAPPVKLGKPGNAAVRAIVGSRSHMDEATSAFIAKFPGAESISMGSSLKFMAVAENRAQIYPRFFPCMEWDTGAAHAIVSVLGGTVFEPSSGSELVYNKEDLTSPYFICTLSPSLLPSTY